MNLLDNPITHMLGRLADFVILNVLWVICSIPVITIGASTTALYAVMLKLVKNEEGYIAKGFLKAFKENFKKSTMIWLVFLLLGILIAIDFFSLKLMPGRLGGGLQVLFLVLGCMLVAASVYAFALQARFENTIKNTLKNAMILLFARLPYTILIMILSIGPVIITFMTLRTLIIGFMLWLIVGVSLVAWLNSFLLRHIFQKLEEVRPQEEEQEQLG